ncbi:MAG: hypothetical protein WC143_08420 [Eubacteriales bacterium]|jgi:hypothetical protein
MNEVEKVLKELSDKINRIKTDIARQEGARQSVMESIEKNFGVKTLEEAKELLAKKRVELIGKEKERDELLELAKEKLKKFE